MKYGVRKPSVKKSFKARTTGRAKRAMKKAVIPGYGKKGTGWIKDPKKAAYNKVYNKTTVGVSDLMAASKSSRKNTSAAKTKTVQYSSNVSKSSSKQKQSLEYNLIIKDKPSIAVPIFFFVIGIIALLFTKIIGTIILAIALYYLYDFEHRSKTKDYISDTELCEWEEIVRKYKADLKTPITYTELANESKIILTQPYYDLSHYYDLLSNESGSISTKKLLELIAQSNVVLDFKKYVTYKTSDVRLLIDRIESKQVMAVQQYIDSEYSKAVEHAKTLKTDAGKLNQIERFKTTISTNLEEIYPNYVDYMNFKISKEDFA